MNETATLIFMVVASTYFVAKLIFLVIENYRRDKAVDKFDEFMCKLNGKISTEKGREKEIDRIKRARK